MWTTKNQKQLLNQMTALKNENYQKFHSKLGVPNVMGVRIPDLERLAKQMVKENNGKEYLNGYVKYNYECDVLYGMIIGYEKLDVKARIQAIKHFATLIDNWATCDYAVSRWKFIKKAPFLYLSLIDDLLKSNEEWSCRLAYVLLLTFYINDEGLQEVLQRLRQPVCEAYYASMAAAWLISIGLAKYPTVFEEALQTLCLPSFVYQKALQKAIESKQILAENKEKYRQWKQKAIKQLLVE